MKPKDMKKHSEWILHRDVEDFLTSAEVPHPWFPAYRSSTASDFRTACFCALVPLPLVQECLQDDGWDIASTEGRPSVWTRYENGKVIKNVYCAFGNEQGIEPLVIYREFHGMREDHLDLSQEFQLFFNLYAEPGRKRFIQFNSDGDESEAVRYGKDFLEIKTDLVLKFCTVKQMALAIYIDSYRHSMHTLEKIGLEEVRLPAIGKSFRYRLAVLPNTFSFEGDYKTVGGLIGKKFLFPNLLPLNGCVKEENYQEFIIDTDEMGRFIKHTCNPDKLSDFFGKNADAPNYLTAVFFRAEVLSKYYSDPGKYSVEDGYLRCGGLWGLRMDNDHSAYVVVWLGDLGSDLSESERNYWLSFNIPPDGKKISRTNFKRAFLAEPADPTKPDLIFKHEYDHFCKDFFKKFGWNFYLPLHADDEHFLTGLHLLSKDSQAEFDTQLIALTKILVDSLNEKQISKELKTVAANDKGITKLEKFFQEQGMVDFKDHAKFLRVLQELRSKSAAHRKGTNYEKLINDLQLADEGQQRVFSSLLTKATSLLLYLRKELLAKREGSSQLKCL